VSKCAAYSVVCSGSMHHHRESLNVKNQAFTLLVISAQSLTECKLLKTFNEIGRMTLLFVIRKLSLILDDYVKMIQIIQQIHHCQAQPVKIRPWLRISSRSCQIKVTRFLRFLLTPRGSDDCTHMFDCS
jgi:hypothetical protein